MKCGTSKSCGCYQRDNKNKPFKYNTYNLSENYGIGYTKKGEKFYFDIEDYDLIKSYYWYCNDKGYVLTGNYPERNEIRQHRLILDCIDSSFFVDHINHNVKDNRKENLRLVTNNENQMNAKLRSNNTSSCTGVYYHKKSHKWYDSIQINKRRIQLGQFVNFCDAVEARRKAEEKYYGEYSYNNSMSNIGEVPP